MRFCALRGLALAAVAVAISASVLAGSATAVRQRKSGCNPAHSKTLVQGAKGRLFDTGVATYYCLFAKPVAHMLTPDEHYGYTLPRINGLYVAYALYIRGATDSVNLINLKSGHRTRFDVGRDGPATVTSLVVKGNGSVAWIDVTEISSTSPDGPTVMQVAVHRRDRSGLVVIDSGAGILPKSLTLAGSTLHWVKGGVRQSAPLR